MGVVRFDTFPRPAIGAIGVGGSGAIASRDGNRSDAGSLVVSILTSALPVEEPLNDGVLPPATA